ncbi:MAG: hypothetical protein SGBAC_010947 [Bacillariaceae sp.]
MVADSDEKSFNDDEIHRSHSHDAILPIGTVRVDYSAANEYIRAHYGDQSPRLPLYFEREESIETVYDARYGVHRWTSEEENPLILEDTKKKTTASLKTCGFTLVSPDVTRKDVKANEDHDWNNLEWIQQNILPQWRDHLKELYHSNQRSIRHVLFWNPMLRGPSKPSTITTPDDDDDDDENEIISTPKASYAGLPHIDMDVNAYDDKFADFMDLMENNKVEIWNVSDDGSVSSADRRQDILDSIQNKNRGFAIVNAWCNVGQHPVRRDPLGLFSVQYHHETTASIAAFPMAAPDMKKSRWYAFSDMAPNEVLFFCQYDRDASWPSDLWHCSLDGISTQNQGQQINDLPSRESFDIRCLLVFEEEVSLDRDRFQHANRPSSLLTLKESGCFCEGQFDERQKEDIVSD